LTEKGSYWSLRLLCAFNFEWFNWANPREQSSTFQRVTAKVVKSNHLFLGDSIIFMSFTCMLIRLGLGYVLLLNLLMVSLSRSFYSSSISVFLSLAKSAIFARIFWTLYSFYKRFFCSSRKMASD